MTTEGSRTVLDRQFTALGAATFVTVGIDQPVQVMEQKSALVSLDASFGFEPVLDQSSENMARKQFRKNPPDE
jgi:hypothetical protein